MKKLFKNKKGFTLMEMLIVVAIIVILVAVSMPVFTSQLEKARKAADDANERAAKAVIVAEYLNPDPEGAVAAGKIIVVAGHEYVYDAVNGTLKENATSAGSPYGKQNAHKDMYVRVKINSDGGVTTRWE